MNARVEYQPFGCHNNIPDLSVDEASDDEISAALVRHSNAGAAHRIGRLSPEGDFFNEPLLRQKAGFQPVVGTTDPTHLRDLCKASEIELTRPEWYALYRAAGNTLP